MNFSTIIGGVVLVALFVGFFYFMKKRNGKPKEVEATITKKTVTNKGSYSMYEFTCDLKTETKTFHTTEPYFNKLEKGMNGILAYRGKELLDFEVFKTNRR